MDQTFTNDSNVQITSPIGGSAHIINWNGLLPVSRGGTGASSFTAGSLLFSNGSIFSQDNSNLFWDDINNQLILGSESNPGHITTPDANNPNANGTQLIITSGSGSGTSVDSGGGLIYIHSGQGFGNGNGGNLDLMTSEGGETGNGGIISILAGEGGTSSGFGGNIRIEAGPALGGNSSGGNLILRGGKKSGTGFDGFVFVQNQYNSFGANLDVSLINTSDKTFTFPNTSGTFGLLEENQAWSGLNKFEASSNSTIYVGSSVKSGCIALGDSDGSGTTYVTANDGVLSASSTPPAICQ